MTCAQHQAAVEIITRLVRHGEYLRQINSNKAFALDRANRYMTIVTVVVAAGVTFIGFIGIEKLVSAVSPSAVLPEDAVGLLFNLLVLALLLMTIVQLVYRLPERAVQHYRAIQLLTQFIGWHDDMIREARAGARKLTAMDSTRARERYLAIAEALPPSTDKEFLKAKKDYNTKRNESRGVAVAAGATSAQDNSATAAATAPAVPAEEHLRDRLCTAVLASQGRREILDLLESFSDHELWLAGGAVRNAVWDDACSFAVETPLEDIDVIWYDVARADKEFDRQLELRLVQAMPNLRWDVKNQARMHHRANHEQYESLNDAMKRFPERCSAVAVRKGPGGVEVIAPWGLKELFDLKVAPSSLGDRSAYQARVIAKRWDQTWPKLAVDSGLRASSEDVDLQGSSTSLVGGDDQRSAESTGREGEDRPAASEASEDADRSPGERSEPS